MASDIYTKKFACPFCKTNKFIKYSYTWYDAPRADKFIKFWHNCPKINSKESITFLYEIDDSKQKMLLDEMIAKFNEHNILYDFENCTLYIYRNINSIDWINYDNIKTKQDYENCLTSSTLAEWIEAIDIYWDDSDFKDYLCNEGLDKLLFS